MEKLYAQGKLIGWISEGVFRKKIEGSKHIHQKLHAIGIDAEEFERSIGPKCHEIRVLDREDNTIYSSSVDNFSDNGIYKHFKPYGKQIFLPLKFWTNETKTDSNS